MEPTEIEALNQKRETKMKKLAKIEDNITAMSSSELLELLHFESKSSLNRAIRAMFEDKINDASFASSLDSRGYVDEYYLPELESKMFVAKHDIAYLEQITQFWIGRNKPASNLLRQESSALEEKMIEELSILELSYSSRVEKIEERSNAAFVKMEEAYHVEIARLERKSRLGTLQIEESIKKGFTAKKTQRQIEKLKKENTVLKTALNDVNTKIVRSGAHEIAHDSKKTAEAITKLSAKVSTQAATLRKTNSLVNILRKDNSNHDYKIEILKQDLEVAYVKLGLDFDVNEYDV